MYDYVVKNGILPTGSYTANTCTRTPNSRTVLRYVNLPAGNETALKQAVGTKGPVSVAIDNSSPVFQTYKTGIMDDPTCSTNPSYAGGFLLNYRFSDLIIKNQFFLYSFGCWIWH